MTNLEFSHALKKLQFDLSQEEYDKLVNFSSANG